MVRNIVHQGTIPTQTSGAALLTLYRRTSVGFQDTECSSIDRAIYCGCPTLHSYFEEL